MTSRRVAILGTRYADYRIEEEAFSDLGVTLSVADGADRDEILSAADGADLVLAGSRPRFDADTVAGLAQQRCRAIVRYGVGVDAIDLDAASHHGLWVVRVSDYGTEPVAYHAVTLAVAATRKLFDAHQRVLEGGWGFAPLRPLHVPSAMSVGIVGFGRIGRRAAASFRALGFTVLAHDAHVDVAELDGEVRAADLDELLSTADVVSLHLPGLAGDRPLLDRERLGLLKPGAVLVNTSRGSLVDQPALLDGLAAGRPGMAALDVYAQEPPDAPEWQRVADRVLLTPHMAWYTEESERDMREQAVAEAVRLLRGERPREPVVDPTASPEG